MELGKLATEQANPLSQAIETLSVAEITQRMNQEDQGVPLAVRCQSWPKAVVSFIWGPGLQAGWVSWMPRNVPQPLASVRIASKA